MHRVGTSQRLRAHLRQADMRDFPFGYQPGQGVHGGLYRRGWVNAMNVVEVYAFKAKPAQ